ncbi:nuclear transport factor 2 family protein [Rheinheimera muenzenbergensis]|uniref:Nuclear transport factor 2 family protein n=1 Tax=Rheinheimera muenzenbergensis TaxID=1193628 RepID=A0ABU8C3W7_9GAMM
MDCKLLTQHLIELEQLLVQPATRLSAELLNRYLADDFYEIGATGRCFGKADVLERLPTETPPEITQQDFTCKVLADGLAQLTYRATIQRAGNDSPSYSVRSSIYRFDGEHWQMIFHQGTACEPFDVAAQPTEVVVGRTTEPLTDEDWLDFATILLEPPGYLKK